MTKIIATLALILGLALGADPAATASTPPPGPGPAQPSSIPGCWKWVLERTVEHRTVTMSGHRFVQYRRVTTYLRWCPGTGYELVTWRSPWGPPRR